MGLTIDVINIGALSRNVLWDEAAPVRPAHATTTLVREGDTTILVDPSLPPEVMEHRLSERAGIAPKDIDVVFLTNFSPVHRRGLSLFAAADWFISEIERQTVLNGLNAVLGGASAGSDLVSYDDVQTEMELLGRLKPAPEKFTKNVHFFPAYGASPGSAALLIGDARTVIVAGDAILTRDYFDQKRVWDRSSDPQQAKESFVEIIEIADAVIPGHDNILYIG